MQDFPVSEMMVVIVEFPGDAQFPSFKTEWCHYLMHQSKVEEFVQAVIALHHSPGINPHSGQPAVPITRIFTEQLSALMGNFWWCNADLQKNGVESGPQVYRVAGPLGFKCIWVSPEEKIRIQEQLHRELKEEWEVEARNESPSV